jgi:hypothetical protein
MEMDMLSFLRKWLFPSAMEDMLMTERKIIRRQRALARFKVMTYPQWCEACELTPDELGINSEVAYAEYVARKDVERRALEHGQHK